MSLDLGKLLMQAIASQITQNAIAVLGTPAPSAAVPTQAQQNAAEVVAVQMQADVYQWLLGVCDSASAWPSPAVSLGSLAGILSGILGAGSVAPPATPPAVPATQPPLSSIVPTVTKTPIAGHLEYLFSITPANRDGNPALKPKP
jgi:hypothetical protein